MKWIMTFNLYIMPLNKILEINIYIWISEKTNGAKDLVKGREFFLSVNR